MHGKIENAQPRALAVTGLILPVGRGPVLMWVYGSLLAGVGTFRIWVFWK